MTSKHQQPGNGGGGTSNNRNSPVSVEPGTWRGTPVPPALAIWFDQLLNHSTLPRILDISSSNSYIDVTFTMAPGGNYAKPPLIQIK